MTKECKKKRMYGGGRSIETPFQLHPTEELAIWVASCIVKCVNKDMKAGIWESLRCQKSIDQNIK